MIEWITTGFRLVWLWAAAVGFRATLRACVWVIVRKALPSRRALAKALMPRLRTVEVRIPGYGFPFYARWPASDLHILYTIVTRNEYAPMADFLNGEREITFLDIGGNIGAASRYVLERFPNARAIAVEPDAGNVQMCRRNLEPYGSRARIIQAAVWKKNTALIFEEETTQVGTEAGVQVREFRSGDDSTQSVRGIDMPTLLSEPCVPAEGQVAVKIDVEGSEEQIFSGTNLDWLDQVDCLAIELHDRVTKNCSRNFFAAVRDRSLEPARKISDTVFVRLKGRGAREAEAGRPHLAELERALSVNHNKPPRLIR